MLYRPTICFDAAALAILFAFAAATANADSGAGLVSCLTVAANSWAAQCGTRVRFVDPYYQQDWTKKYQSTYPFYQTGPDAGPFYNVITRYV